MPKSFLFSILVVLAWGGAGPVSAGYASGHSGQADHQVLILDYHRFNSYQADSMTLELSAFAFQLRYMQEHGYHFIPLAQYVDYRLRKAPAPPPRAVVITMDDGHESVYTRARPMIERYRIPVTLFIYPSAISHASYAMTWEQLRALKSTGLFDIQCHTYWHPNFKTEKKRLSPSQYQKFIDKQIVHSKAVLDTKLGTHVTMLAWPFGIYDSELIRKAKEAGYTAAFALNGRHTADADNVMSISRYLVTDRDKGRFFENVLQGTPARR